MNAIVVAFTLKGQDFSKIKEKLQEVAVRESHSILIHGFMSHKAIIEKGFSPEVVDTLEELFPVQLNMYKGKPLREEMVDVAKDLHAHIYTIGEIKEGVAEEVNLYKAAGFSIIEIPL